MKSLKSGTAVVVRLVWLITAGLTTVATSAWAAKPEPWQMGLQPPISPAGENIDALHDALLWLIFAIVLLVMGLLIYVCIRFRASAHPNPTRTTHNTVLEIAWTAVPVIMLVLIAIPSFTYLYYIDKAVEYDMSIKVTANQWFWNYEYLDDGVSFDSYMIKEADLQPGQLRLLEVDNRLVVPINTKIQVLVTSNDVMHAFFLPAAHVQIYGVPGRINETWAQFNREGVFYGQCNQICGIDHSYMPIVVEALSAAAYADWLKQAKQKFASTGSKASVRVAVARQ